MKRYPYDAAVKVGAHMHSGPAQKNSDAMVGASLTAGLCSKASSSLPAVENSRTSVSSAPIWGAQMLRLVGEFELIGREQRGEGIAVREIRHQERGEDRSADQRTCGSSSFAGPHHRGGRPHRRYFIHSGPAPYRSYQRRTNEYPDRVGAVRRLETVTGIGKVCTPYSTSTICPRFNAESLRSTVYC